MLDAHVQHVALLARTDGMSHEAFLERDHAGDDGDHATGVGRGIQPDVAVTRQRRVRLPSLPLRLSVLEERVYPLVLVARGEQLDEQLRLVIDSPVEFSPRSRLHGLLREL